MKATWVYHPGCRIAGWWLWLFGGGRIEGLEHLPRSGPFIIVANHCSQADPPLLGWATGFQIGRVVYFMAKEEMRHWPVIGWLAERSGVFFVRRGEVDRAAQRQALQLLADGKPIAIFPEGTRSRSGHMRLFRPGAALIGLRSGAPVLPVGIAGSHRLFPGRSRWPRRSRVTFHIGAPFTLGHQSTGRIDRDALAEANRRLEAAVAELLPPEQRPVGATYPDS